MNKFLPAVTVTVLGATICQAYADDAAPSSAQPAQTAPVTAGKNPAEKPADNVQQVTISSGRLSDVDQRRQSTASKLIFGREELDRNGDSSIGEVLKRLPGVTLSGRPGRGGDIRMRGLGNGYTQILVNGERPPRGFSLDSLAPDQVERIEIIRGPVAEYSTQAIAGTINIVLREDFQQRETQIRISDGLEQGRHAPNLSVTHPGQAGNLTYLLSGTIAQNRQRNQVVTTTQDIDQQGTTTSLQDLVDESVRTSDSIHLTPRFSYRFDGGDTLMLQPFLMHTRSDVSGASELIQTVGTTAPYATANWTTRSETGLDRLFGNWQHRLQGGGKLNIKFGGGTSRSTSDTLRAQYNAGGTLRNNLIDTSDTKDRSANTSGKYTNSVGDGHALALGWDVDWGWRTQTRVSLDNGLPQFFDSGENLSAKTRRLAAFAQDEWDINAQWSMYAGLRWEGIVTSSTTPRAIVTNDSSVWSPVLHSVWRIPGHEKDQLRMSLTHSYRAPSLSDLIALPVLSRLNSATSPDRIGNPDLKPELSTGIDFAYEHYLNNGGLLSANVFTRNIDNLMRRRTSLQSNGSGLRWVSEPINIGHATASGIELEAKFKLAALFPNAPAIDFNGNYSRFWSRVDEVPGPNNRLDQQPRQTANLGIDYRLAATPLTLGGSINWTPAYVVQTSESQTSSAGVKRQVDLYGLWKINPAAQLRISANNLVNNDYQTGSSVTAGGLTETGSATAKTYTTWTIKLEFKI